MSTNVVAGAPPMSIREARELIALVRTSVDQVRGAITRLYSERAWEYLGYDSWEALCAEEFGMRLALTRADRGHVIEGLRSAGMSTRAIGSALGVSPGTVHADLSGVQNRTPESESVSSAVTGTDGKTYPRKGIRLKAPRMPRLRGLAAEYAEAVGEAERAIGRLRRLHLDPRFSAEWESLTTAHATALTDLLSALKDLEKGLRTGPNDVVGPGPTHACAGPVLCRTVGCRA